MIPADPPVGLYLNGRLGVIQIIILVAELESKIYTEVAFARLRHIQSKTVVPMPRATFANP